MAPLTRQDIQAVIDNARTRLLDYVATRQDVQTLKDSTKNLNTTLQQSQQFLRQEERQRTELIRRLSALETRMVQLEHDMQDIRRGVGTLANQQPQEKVTERVIVTGPEERQRYVYTPA